MQVDDEFLLDDFDQKPREFAPIKCFQPEQKSRASSASSSKSPRRTSLSNFLAGSKKEVNPYKKYTFNIKDYDLLEDVGGVDDISFLYLARFKPTNELVTLKYTDMSLSPDYEFVQELIVCLFNLENFFKH